MAWLRAVEQAIEGLTRGLGVEVGEAGDELVAHRRPALVLALDELADGEQRRCRPRRGARRSRLVAQPRHRHVGVLVGAERVLQRLEHAHERLARRRLVQPAEALDEVAQTLGVLAQLVHLGRRRVGPDRAAGLDERPVGTSDALGHQWPDRVSGQRRDLATRRIERPVEPAPTTTRGTLAPARW